MAATMDIEDAWWRDALVGHSAKVVLRYVSNSGYRYEIYSPMMVSDYLASAYLHFLAPREPRAHWCESLGKEPIHE